MGVTSVILWFACQSQAVKSEIMVVQNLHKTANLKSMDSKLEPKFRHKVNVFLKVLADREPVDVGRFTQSPQINNLEEYTVY